MGKIVSVTENFKLGESRNMASLVKARKAVSVLCFRTVWPRWPRGYGHELTAGVSRVRALVPLKTRHAEGLMHARSVEAQSSSVVMMWN
ncbi:hypothetical protein TNCV_3632891 [Trichonephila clavipes]|nr:hypothetical protein TNCV_3632891 [Trichonephila clavipes]